MSDVAISAALDGGMAGNCNATSQAAMTITQAREPRQHRQHRRKHRRGDERRHNGGAGGKIQMTEHRMRFLLEPSDQAWRAWEPQQLRKIPPSCMEYLGVGDSRHRAVDWH